MTEDNKKQGWVLLHRSIRNHWLWSDSKKLQAWIDLILEANHAEKKVMIKNQLIVCKRGESCKSLGTWAKRWGWSKSAVVRFLKLLENDSMIETKSTTKTKHISICNYDSYQSLRNDNETIPKPKRNDSETILKPNNETNKRNETNETNEIPKNALPFSSETFKTIWNDWEKHRQEIKKKLTPMAVKKQFSFLASLTEKEAIQSIESSIQNGYTGLFPPKNSKPQKQNSNYIKNL